LFLVACWDWNSCPTRRKSLDSRNPAADHLAAGGNAYVNEMRKMIRSFPEVESVVSQHGRPDDAPTLPGFSMRNSLRR